MTPNERAAEMISKAMIEAGFTQLDLAPASGLSRSTICNILAAKRGISVTTLFTAVEACGFEIIELRVRRKSGS